MPTMVPYVICSYRYLVFDLKKTMSILESSKTWNTTDRAVFLYFCLNFVALVKTFFTSGKLEYRQNDIQFVGSFFKIISIFYSKSKIRVHTFVDFPVKNSKYVLVFSVGQKLGSWASYERLKKELFRRSK